MKLLFSFLFFLTSCTGSPPQDLGVSDNKLSACPNKSNCIVSFQYEAAQKNFLEPIKSEEEPERIRKKIEGIVSKTPGVTIIKNEADYIYAEYTSSLGFVNDVEFWFGESGKVHFRSASRIGFHDLGGNKERIETLRFKFHQNDF